jgi:predicted permease
MNWIGQIWRRVRMLARRGKFASELDEEMRLHREMKERELAERGVAADEARYAAARAFGNEMNLRERGRDAWGWRWLEDLVQDLRFGARMLRKNPGFTFVAVLTLALGIGVNTAIFTLVHAVMLKSLPVEGPEQLYNFGANDNCCVLSGVQDDVTLFSTPLYEQLRDHSPEFEQVAAFPANLVTLGVRRAGTTAIAEPYRGELVSGNYFEMLRVRAYVGRTIVRDDDKRSAPSVAMMSYRVWSQHFDKDPSVIGAIFAMNGRPVTVVGITPPGFFGETLRSDPPDFWMALAQEPTLRGESSVYDHPELFWLYLMGRQRPGTNLVSTEARLTAETQQWLNELPNLEDDDRKLIPKARVRLTPARSGTVSLRGDYGSGLRLLMAVSGMVLLIACANVANMLLARATAQSGQTTVRSALGASRLRLIRQTLAESTLLAVIGGAAAVAMAFAGTRFILALAFRGSDYIPIEATPSWPVLAFAFGLSLATGAIFGTAPAWIRSRANPADVLRGAGRGTRGRSSWAGQTLVALQAAMSLVLLAGAGLLMVSLQRLQHQQFGFQTRGRLIVRVDPTLAGYTSEQLAALYRRVQENLNRLPGVELVSLSLHSPLEGGNWSFGAAIEGHKDSVPHASWNRVAAHYFETIGTRVLRGRGIGEQDTPNAQRVAVVSEAFVKQGFANGEEPISRHLGFGDRGGDYEIVGVVEDAKYQDAYAPPYPSVFLPLLQDVAYQDPSEASMQARTNHAQNIELLVAAQTANLEALIRETLATTDPNLTVFKLTSLGEQVSLNFNQERLVSRLTGLFGLLALVLACVGLYGVTAYGVAQRKGEIGLRMALGAERAHVVRMVVQGAMVQIGVGLLVGIPVALGAGHALAHQLFGVRSYDPLILGGAALVLGIAALLAGLMPAMRAASIDPMEALRAE